MSSNKRFATQQSKCEFLSPTLLFFGQVFSKDGTRPAYASRALTDTETRYSQTEKEALAIIWAVEHSHFYLFGIKFTLVMDHKLLEIIYGQRTSKTSARIERWVLLLQRYAFKIIYRSGISNPADSLSRHPTHASKRKQEKMTEQYINFVVENSEDNDVNRNN